MADGKTIGITSLSSVIATLLIIGGINLFDTDDVYYCEDRQIAMQCDSLSAYYGLDNGKCWNSEYGNKLCKTGWLEVINDTESYITLESTGDEDCVRIDTNS